MSMCDISKCYGLNCNIREKCYRYMASPDKHCQCYVMIEDKVDKEEDCSVFWSLEERNV